MFQVDFQSNLMDFRASIHTNESAPILHDLINTDVDNTFAFSSVGFIGIFRSTELHVCVHMK